MEMPALEKEATRSLQEENLELHQQVSLLSQWNDKHEQTISSLEQQLETAENEKNQIKYQLTQAKALEQVSDNIKYIKSCTCTLMYVIQYMYNVHVYMYKCVCTAVLVVGRNFGCVLDANEYRYFV